MKKGEFDFGLVIGGISKLTDDISDALFEAGCDDATFSVRHGLVFAEFSRQSKSLKDAILSAIHDIRAAKVGASVWRVDQSDLISPSEIGRKIERSRQVVYHYITGQRGPGNFPPPECRLGEGDPLWAWSTVSAWMAENNIVRPEEQSEASVVAIINNALEASRQSKRNPKLFSEVVAAVR